MEEPVSASPVSPAPSHRPRTRIVLVAAGLLAVGLGVFMAWRQAAGPGPRIVLIGMDALTWDVLDPLLAQGKLPNFKALIDRGAQAELKTMRSTYISASIWTTIITGKHPKKHGIEGFFTAGGFSVNSTHRKTRQLAQILSAQGLSTAMVGFWATWPAEKIDGWVVSDLASYGRFKDVSQDAGKSVRDYSYLKTIPHVTWPEDLVDEILPAMKSPDDFDRASYQAVLPMDDELWKKFSAIDRLSREDPLSLLKFSIVTDLNFHHAGLELLKRHRPQAYMIYLEGPDIIEHFFWGYMDPAGLEVPPEEVKAFGPVIENYYKLMDRILGETLAAVPQDALVVLCSDHGMKKVRFAGQDAAHSGEHRLSKPDGVIIMAGPGVKPIARKLTGPVVYDVVPTILYLLGLPIGQDMDGKILMDLIDDDFKARSSIRMVPTLDAGHKAPPELVSPLDQSVKDRLREIGYLD